MGEVSIILWTVSINVVIAKNFDFSFQQNIDLMFQNNSFCDVNCLSIYLSNRFRQHSQHSQDACHISGYAMLPFTYESCSQVQY